MPNNIGIAMLVLPIDYGVHQHKHRRMGKNIDCMATTKQ
jgi:hypothetical protein